MKPTLEELVLSLFTGPAPVPLGGGATVHLIDKATTVGPGRELAGCILVETADGAFHKMTGAELVAFATSNPWVKRWRLDGWREEEGEEGEE